MSLIAIEVSNSFLSIINADYNLEKFIDLDIPRFMDVLKNEIGENKYRDFETFSKALQKAVEASLKQELTPDDEELKQLTSNINETLVKISKMNTEGIFDEIYPMRLMLCWDDSLAVMQNANEVATNKLESLNMKVLLKKETLSPKATLILDGIGNLFIAMSMLMYRIYEQITEYENRTLEFEADPGKEREVLDEYVELLARDITILTTVQNKYHLFDSSKDENLLKFQDSLLERYQP